MVPNAEVGYGGVGSDVEVWQRHLFGPTSLTVKGKRGSSQRSAGPWQRCVQRLIYVRQCVQRLNARPRHEQFRVDDEMTSSGERSLKTCNCSTAHSCQVVVSSMQSTQTLVTTSVPALPS